MVITLFPKGQNPLCHESKSRHLKWSNIWLIWTQILICASIYELDRVLDCGVTADRLGGNTIKKQRILACL